MKLYKEADVNRKKCGEIIDKIEGKYEMRFQRIVILGNGKIAVDCLYALLNYVDKTKIFVIESQYSPVSLLKKL